MTEENHNGERIAKRIARAGLCSRRDAERWIGEGRVILNGQKLESPAVVVNDADDIVVDGKALPRKEATRLFLYHKPAGLVTSHKDDRGRETVFDALPKSLPRLLSVGRLDLNSEGLLLLTNDGALSRYLELPATALKRCYRVRVLGRIDLARLEGLKNGITVDGVRYGSIDAQLESGGQVYGANNWIRIVLQEGKNREIRRVMTELGLEVNRLIRVSYGSFELKGLDRGGVKEISTKDLKAALPGYFKGGT